MKRLLFLAALSIAFVTQPSNTAPIIQDNNCTESCAIGQNTWLPRSFSSYPSRDIFLIKTMHNVESPRYERFGTLSFATEYMQDFGQKCDKSCKNLGARPFWSGTNSMTYGTNDGNSYVDAYQLGMGDVKTQGEIELDTRIMHIGTDFLLHFVQDIQDRGPFFKIHVPVGAMRVKHTVTEKIAKPDSAKNIETNNVWLSYPSTPNRYESVTEFFQGGSTTIDGTGLNSSVHKPLALEYGRLSSCPNSSIRVGDLALTLGYNVYGTEKAFVAVGVKGIAPTGTIPAGRYITEPIFGRGGYWGIGIETTGHWKIWHNDADTRGVDFWAQAEALHLRSGRRPNFRSFDLLANGKGSKYLLTQFYFPSNPVAGNSTGRIPSFLTHVVNITTLPVTSRFNIEGALALMVDVLWDNWNVSIGSEFWGRSKEQLAIDCCSLINANAVNLNDFAIVGRQVSENVKTGTPVPLYLCEPLAKINKSEKRVDNLSSAYDESKIKDARFGENRIPSDYTQALDICGAAAARALTCRLFGQFGYTWKKYDYNPNLSIILGAEMSPWKNDNSISLWSAGVQGSLNF